MLALAGERDHVNPSSTVRRITNRFPHDQADFQEIANMSHWLMGEPEWPQVAKTVLNWLSVREIKPSIARAARKKAMKILPWNASAAGG